MSPLSYTVITTVTIYGLFGGDFNLAIWQNLFRIAKFNMSFTLYMQTNFFLNSTQNCLFKIEVCDYLDN